VASNCCSYEIFVAPYAIIIRATCNNSFEGWWQGGWW
jgi:hypothetical protein